MSRTLDLTPLTDPVERRDVAEFFAGVSRQPGYSRWSVGLIIFQSIWLLLFILPFLGLFILFAVFIAEGELVVPRSPGEVTAGIVALLVMSLLFGGLIYLLGVGLSDLGRDTVWYRLTRFAVANGIVFSPWRLDPEYPGALFTKASFVTVLDHLHPAEGAVWEYGTVLRSDRKARISGSEHGFIALRLERRLPHMLLDARSNNVLTDMIRGSVQRDQTLHLEGDFDRHFTLYCPTEYETDALYLFTPDLMALLIDDAAPFDVEVIDDWLFFYSPKPLDLRQPAVHERVFRIIDVVGAKALSQSSGYRDERSGSFAANLVAAPGQRLRSRVAIGGVIATVVAFVIVFSPLLVGLVTGG